MMKKAPKIIFSLSLVLALVLIILITSFIFLRLTDKKEVTTSSSSITSTSKKTKKSKASTSSSSSVVSSDSSKATISSSTTSTSDTNSSSTSNSETSSGADIPALHKGDFSSIEGTWYDDTGRILTVYSDGFVIIKSDGNTYSAKIFDVSETKLDSIYSVLLVSEGSSNPYKILTLKPTGSRNFSGETLAHDIILLGDPTAEDTSNHPFVKK